MITVTRSHEFSAGHRVCGHSGRCKYLHGHNYKVFFEIAHDQDRLDNLGMVIDFALIKAALCTWIDSNYDHKMLIWEQDPLLSGLLKVSFDSIVKVPYNPTAENIAKYLVEVVAPERLKGTNCTLISCTIQETEKCQATMRI